ncbi:hypothetical protein ZWY2020_040984 [Hordeum vulgare]|nr:hypothetical protein ZWY2020_040984 [Hordeum vulgare]
MYSCNDRDPHLMESSARYQPCNTAATRTAASRVNGRAAAAADAARQEEALGVGVAPVVHHRGGHRRVNFRAMVQELTGFPAAAIFRPLPRRAHAASQSLAAVAHGCGGAPQGHRSDTATTAGNVPAVVQPPAHPPQCAPPGVFDGLPDLGSPEFDAWPDLSFE